MAHQQGPPGQPPPHHATAPAKPNVALTVGLILIGVVGLVCLLAPVLGLVLYFFDTGNCGAQCTTPSPRVVDPAEAKIRHTVVFEAESPNGASSQSTVNYASWAASIPALESGPVRLPHRQTVEIVGPVPELSMSVDSYPEGREVTCRITVDGQVVPQASNSSTVEARCVVPGDQHTPPWAS
ncbi:hypothetical protein [Planotetraspora mira]|uniref:MmpS family membrane protein n=1 Tax=Planotetraspora mira TaxID=58121 RepID=A0A8J3TX85_9ACTN|nr:hypothetical protein [Planotetraspora mira]GII34273.1 hypothetical protein Pmi06nite_77150 [Planotetraspora mira]